jgi:mannose/cellobiose epimerase-like protein (N-acyl-D-glucosamine 2-epimerase family)
VRHRVDDPAHHRWLEDEAARLLMFYRGSADPAGGFYWLDDDGRPTPGEPTYLWITARMVHGFSLAHLLGEQHVAELVDHGLQALGGLLRDQDHGGWFWSARPHGPVDDSKQAYGQAFVLLAAASATQAGRPDAPELLDEALTVLDQRFWREDDQLSVDKYSRDWTTLEPYRGANANMHLAEALLAVADATGNPTYLDRAAAIVERVVNGFARTAQWRVPEHYDEGWQPLLEYNIDAKRDPFRPYGSTVGHWLEWARLALQLSVTDRTSAPWMLPAATKLFDRAVADGWDDRYGGFVYTVDWNGQPVIPDRLHWVVTEAIGASAALYRATGDARYDDWYGRFWDYAAQKVIDHDQGSWMPQLDETGNRVTDPWHGKPDLYHALQATLFARVPFGRSLAAVLR